MIEEEPRKRKEKYQSQQPKILKLCFSYFGYNTKRWPFFFSVYQRINKINSEYVKMMDI